jgi:hypothetical protein
VTRRDASGTAETVSRQARLRLPTAKTNQPGRSRHVAGRRFQKLAVSPSNGQVPDAQTGKIGLEKCEFEFNWPWHTTQREIRPAPVEIVCQHPIYRAQPAEFRGTPCQPRLRPPRVAARGPAWDVSRGATTYRPSAYFEHLDIVKKNTNSCPRSLTPCLSTDTLTHLNTLGRAKRSDATCGASAAQRWVAASRFDAPNPAPPTGTAPTGYCADRVLCRQGTVPKGHRADRAPR